MTDPFEALREPVTPVDPDPQFAAQLRQRLTREIIAYPGGTMSQQSVATTVERQPAWPPTLTPYLVVSDARRAMNWYIEVFDAQPRGGLHVNEDGVWRAASVREWVPDPATAVTPKNIEWLVGEWTAKGEGGELKITYAWDENKAFINSKYSLTKDGKTLASGTQVIARNPAGGLRSWLFDSSGTFGEATWVRDDKRWVNEATGVLPDGTEITSAAVGMREYCFSSGW